MLERKASVNSALPPPSPTPSQPPPSPSPSAYDEARKQRLSAMLDTLPPELERRLSVHHGIKPHRYDTVSGKEMRLSSLVNTLKQRYSPFFFLVETSLQDALRKQYAITV